MLSNPDGTHKHFISRHYQLGMLPNKQRISRVINIEPLREGESIWNLN